ncbi:MAG: hypothetical protein ACKO2F_11130 [Cyanobacteriota bacterium]
MDEVLTIVQLHEDTANAQLPTLTGQQQEVVAWVQSLDNNAWMLEIGESLSKGRQGLNLKSAELKINHSLTTDFSTWLLGEHGRFGSVLVLQLNYALEAILFDDLDLYVLAPQGIQQGLSLASLWGQLASNTLHTPGFGASLKKYLESGPKFGGLNVSYHSPFHTMTFGHPGLLKYHLQGYDLRAKALVVKNHLWFQAAHLFPTVVSEAKEFTPTGRFLELEAASPVFFCKVGDLYRLNNTEGHRLLDLAYLAVSTAYIPTVRNLLQLGDGAVKGLWVGLTSGKRQLLNEQEVVLATVETLMDTGSLSCTFIDGWTGSSSLLEHGETTPSTPAGYESHGAEADACRDAINKRWPALKVRSLVGLPYEYKVAAGLLCSYSLTSAYTSSVIPARVCSLPGVIHSSRVGRQMIDMHIWRHSEFVPDELITDQLEPEADINPLDADYMIDVNEYSRWLAALRRQQESRDF